MDQYLSVILGLEPNQSYAAMLGLVVQFCTAQKEIDIIKRHKVNLPCCFFFFFKKISSIAFHHGEGGGQMCQRSWYFPSAPGFIIHHFSSNTILVKTMGCIYRGSCQVCGSLLWPVLLHRQPALQLSAFSFVVGREGSSQS